MKKLPNYHASGIMIVLDINSHFLIICLFVGNMAKGGISKRLFQENKARQIFRKTNFSYLLIRTRAFE